MTLHASWLYTADEISQTVGMGEGNCISQQRDASRRRRIATTPSTLHFTQPGIGARAASRLGLPFVLLHQCPHLRPEVTSMSLSICHSPDASAYGASPAAVVIAFTASPTSSGSPARQAFDDPGIIETPGLLHPSEDAGRPRGAGSAHFQRSGLHLARLAACFRSALSDRQMACLLVSLCKVPWRGALLMWGSVCGPID